MTTFDGIEGTFVLVRSDFDTNMRCLPATKPKIKQK